MSTIPTEKGALQEDRNQNPWPGLEPYNESDQDFFYGRSTESDQLFRRVKREILTVVFGASGTGKTSLLNAGLFPRLNKIGFLPVRIRLDFFSRESLVQQVKHFLKENFTEKNIEIFEIVEAKIKEDEETLWEYLHRVEFWDEKNQPVTPVLVFDQFEEIFSIGNNIIQTDFFVAELASLVENHIPQSVRNRLEKTGEKLGFSYSRQHYRIVLALRDDFVSHLDGLRPQMPSIMHNRFSLRRMTGTQAINAVLGPGHRIVEEPVARQIVRFVAAANSDDPAVNGEIEFDKLSVEPALLSIFCRELNFHRLEQGLNKINTDLLTGNRDEIISDFYEKCIHDLPDSAKRFIEDGLLTSSGYRNSIALDDALHQYDIAVENIAVLEDRRLLRREDRLGTTRIELVHDVLTGVIAERRDKRKTIEEDIRKKQRETRLKKKLRRSRLIISTFASLIVIMIGLFVFGLHHWQTAKKNDHEANYNLFTVFKNQGQSYLEGKSYERAAVFLGAAFVLFKKYDQFPAKLEAEDSLSIPLAKTLRRLREKPVHMAGHAQKAMPVRSVSFGRQRLRVLTSGSDGAAILWDAVTGRQLRILKDDEAVYGPTHDDSVVSAAFSHDGTRILTAGKDSIIKLWGVKSDQPLIKYGGHDFKPFYSTYIVLSNDNTLLVSGALDGTIRIWNFTTGSQGFVFSGHVKSVNCIDFSPDDKLLASGSGDATIRIWDVETGKQSLILSGHEEEKSVNSIAFSSDGSLLASGSDDATVRIWDVATGQEVLVLTGHADPVNSIAFSSDGKLLASGSDDSTIRIWDVETGKEVLVLAGHEDRVNSIAFSGESRLLASGSGDETIRLWDVETGTQIRVLSGHRGSINSIAFSSDGRLLASGSDDSTIRIWDVSSGSQKAELSGHQAHVNSVVFSSDGQYVISGSMDRVIRIWRVRTGQLHKTLTAYTHTGAINDACFSPDDKMIVSAGQDAVAIVWDVRSGLPLRAPLGHSEGKAVNSARFSNGNGTSVVTTCDDGVVRIWDIHTPGIDGAHRFDRKIVPYKTLENYGDHIIVKSSDKKAGQLFKLAMPDIKKIGSQESEQWLNTAGREGKIHMHGAEFSQDNKYVLCYGDDTRVIVWDTEQNEPKILDGHSDIINSAVFAPEEYSRANNKSIVLSAGRDGTARIWEVNDAQFGNCLQILEGGHDKSINSAIFIQHGESVITAGDDGKICLWHTATGSLLDVMQHPGEKAVYCAAFDEENQSLVTGDEQGRLYIWKIRQNNCLEKTLAGHDAAVEMASVYQDGEYILTGSKDGTVILWDPETGKSLSRFFHDSSEWINNVSLIRNKAQLSVLSVSNSWIKTWGTENYELINTIACPENFGFSDAVLLPGNQNAIITSVYKKYGAKPDARLVDNDQIAWIKWDPFSGQRLGEAKESHNNVHGVAVSKDGLHVLTLGDGAVKIWNAEDGQLNITIGSKEEIVTYARFFPVSNRLVVVRANSDIEIYRIQENRAAKTVVFQGDDFHKKQIWSVSIDGNENYLLTLSADHTARLWDIGSGSFLRTLTGHESDVTTADFSADGRLIVTGSDDRTIKTWETKTGNCLETFLGHSGPIRFISFQDKTRRIISTSMDGTVKLWKTGSDLDDLPKQAESIADEVLSMEVWDNRVGRTLLRDDWVRTAYHILQNATDKQIQQ